jgi:hypothetical protein
MSNPEERERESRAAQEDKFSEAMDEERRKRSEVAQQLREERLDEDDSEGEETSS